MQHSCGNWVSPLTIYIQQSPDHTKTASQPLLDIDFLIDSGATFNVLNNDTWNEIKDCQKLPLKASTFVLSAAYKSKLQSYGTIKLILYPDVIDNRTLRNTSFTLTFQVSKTKFNILGPPFLEKYMDLIKCSSHSIEIKHNHETKSLKYYDSSIKSPQQCSQFFPVVVDRSLHSQPFEHRTLTFSLSSYEC